MLTIIALSLAMTAGILLGGVLTIITLNIAAATHRRPRRPRYTDDQASRIIDTIHKEAA